MASHFWDKRKQAWCLTVEAGRDPTTGKRRRRKRYVKESELGTVKGRKLDERLMELRVEFERAVQSQAPIIDPGNLTVEGYLGNWLRLVYPTVRANTYRSYESKLRVHVVPRIGKARLRALSRLQVQRLFSDLQSSGLSGQTVKHIHRVLSHAMAQAVRFDLLAKNPCDAVVLAAVERYNAPTLAPDEAARLLIACLEADTPHTDAISLALVCGMRQEEVLGLYWSRVDLERGYLRVERTRQFVPRVGMVEDEPKTKRSRRQLALGDLGVAVLRRVRARQPIPIGDALVFGDVMPQTLARHLDRLTRDLGLTRVTPHGLRHTNASLLHAAGVDAKTISEHLGHAGIGITLDTYVHLQMKADEGAIRQFESMMAPLMAPQGEPENLSSGTEGPK